MSANSNRNTPSALATPFCINTRRASRDPSPSRRIANQFFVDAPRNAKNDPLAAKLHSNAESFRISKTFTLNCAAHWKSCTTTQTPLSASKNQSPQRAQATQQNQHPTHRTHREQLLVKQRCEQPLARRKPRAHAPAHRDLTQLQRASSSGEDNVFQKPLLHTDRIPHKTQYMLPVLGRTLLEPAPSLVVAEHKR
eukprot:2029538-Rhodomonas_salina.1